MNFMQTMFGGGSRGGSPIGQPNGATPTGGGNPTGGGTGGVPNQNQDPQITNPAGATGGVVPPNGAQGTRSGQQGQGGTVGQPAPNSLDTFTPLFNNEPKSGENKQPQLFDPFFTDDHFTNLQQHLAQQTFAKITPEVMQKMMSGDPSALAGVIDQALQSAFMMSTRLNNSMMSESLKTYHGRFQPELDTKFNTFHGQQALNSQHPALQHPAMRPMVDALRAQFSQASPNDTPTQINEKIISYMKQVPAAFGSNDGGTGGDPIGGNSRQQQPQNQNWSGWFQQNGRR